MNVHVREGAIVFTSLLEARKHAEGQVVVRIAQTVGAESTLAREWGKPLPQMPLLTLNRHVEVEEEAVQVIGESVTKHQASAQ